MVSDIVYWCEQKDDGDEDGHRRIVTCSKDQVILTNNSKGDQKLGVNFYLKKKFYFEILNNLKKNVYIHDEDHNDKANSVRYFMKQH